jgi:hypothetical protein
MIPMNLKTSLIKTLDKIKKNLRRTPLLLCHLQHALQRRSRIGTPTDIHLTLTDATINHNNLMFWQKS